MPDLPSATCPPAVFDLIARFTAQRDAYQSGAYNETQVRREFIDPLFKALGWDMDNAAGLAEAYKDIIHEDAIKIGGETKAPDYCFRIGGTRKFFVEAKKPSVAIGNDPTPAFQLRRYGWSARMSLSILTDFEEFAVYDCRIRPLPTDKPSVARVFYCKFDQYPEKWSWITGHLSKDAILKGAFDRFAESTSRKRGTAPVDTEFLREIETWRDVFARNIALRNPKLSVRDLNFAVGKIIDRIIFLRMCEDRGIETYAQLRDVLNGTAVYRRLCELFRRADDRYNSGLFHFQTEKGRPEQPDELTPTLDVDDQVLKDIIRTLYYPESPYEFSVLPAEILGQVYEQFLGKVIRLTAGHRAVVEEKPAVRKAGGVYYTPAYIVDYIVKHTLGALLSEAGRAGPEPAVPVASTPDAASKLRILDPACGSGSFLLGAFQYLLDWHRDWYNDDGPEKWTTGRNPRLYQSGAGYRLTTAARKRILLDSIYGVDIDPQAVEVTKLSLLLKVLEGESRETIERQLKLYHERALPDLANNIKCGNSLIGPDFFNGNQLELFDDEQQDRINVFDWQAEFPEILKPSIEHKRAKRAGPSPAPAASSGFDAVIGNPPWGADFSAHEIAYFRQHYDTATGRTIDSYALFMESALQRLRNGGRLGYITPDTYLRKDDYEQIRRWVLGTTSVHQLVETGPVFHQVRDTWCAVTVLSKTRPNENQIITHRKLSRFIVSSEERLRKFGSAEWDAETTSTQAAWMSRPRAIVSYLPSDADRALISKLQAHPTLGEMTDFYRVSRGEEGSKFNIRADSRGHFVMVTPEIVERFRVGAGVPVSERTLTKTKVTAFYRHPKIWIIRIQKLRWPQRLVCALDVRKTSAAMKTLQLVVSPSDKIEDLSYLLALLNSTLINYWCISHLADDMNQSYLARIPIAQASTRSRSRRRAPLVNLVERIISLHKKLAAARSPTDKTALQRQIAATDRQIDQLVYDLYGLTDEEIRIIEDATVPK